MAGWSKRPAYRTRGLRRNRRQEKLAVADPSAQGQARNAAQPETLVPDHLASHPEADAGSPEAPGEQARRALSITAQDVRR
jgi:hypothetical protein